MGEVWCKKGDPEIPGPESPDFLGRLGGRRCVPPPGGRIPCERDGQVAHVDEAPSASASLANDALVLVEQTEELVEIADAKERYGQAR